MLLIQDQQERIKMTKTTIKGMEDINNIYRLIENSKRTIDGRYEFVSYEIQTIDKKTNKITNEHEEFSYEMIMWKWNEINGGIQ